MELIKKKKKYRRLKTENSQLHKRIIELERDIINNKDFFQKYIAPIPSNNCIQMITMPTPIPMPVQLNYITPTPTPTPKPQPTNMGMLSVINELKNKFNKSC